MHLDPLSSESSSGPIMAALTRPYRLDLTVAVLRRLSTNAVDVWDGRSYLRAIDGNSIVEVHEEADALVARVYGAPVPGLVARIERTLGTRADIEPFVAAAAQVDWLRALAQRMRGVRPPRYATLWEAIVNAIVFQQVSIHAASAILRRTIEGLEAPVRLGERVLYPFPSPQRFLDADPEALRSFGASVNKVVALRGLARAIVDGALREDDLEPLTTAAAIERLVTYRGIGPWTAAVIALRGLGRLDVFPMRDSGVARSLRELAGDPEVDAERILAVLGPQRGMLYYHLLLGRLAARGEIVDTGG